MHYVVQGFWLFTPLIPSPLFYGLSVLAFFAFGFGMASRLSVWVQGSSDKRGGVGHRSLAGLLALSLTQILSPQCLFSRRLFPRSLWRGATLMSILWGFLLTLIAVLFSFLTLFLPASQLPREAQRIAAVCADLGGGLLLVGVLAALVRRYALKPRLVVSVAGDGRLLWLLFLTLVVGFLAKGQRLSFGPLEGLLWHPVGSLFGALLYPVMDQVDRSLLYQATYTLHVLLGIALVAYLPYSKLFHIFAAQITTYAASLRQKEARHGYRGSPATTQNILLHRGA